MAGRTDSEQQIYEEGRLAGVTHEQITTLFKKVDAIEEGQVSILKKLEDLNSFKAWVMGAASSVSLIVSVAYHMIKEFLHK